MTGAARPRPGSQAAPGRTRATPGARRRPRGAGAALVGWLRWGWRQLTSMRTALVLLFLLALASVPGSLLPQQGIDPAAVQQYYASHPGAGALAGPAVLFNVFAAPWFAAIYLLLFASLAGCVVPRTLPAGPLGPALPPPAPRNLARLPQSARLRDRARRRRPRWTRPRRCCGRRKFRLRTGDGWVSAEKGYLREVGNLLFHLALLGLLVSVALGGLFGYKANRLLVDGHVVRQHGDRAGRVPPGPAGVRRPTCSRSRITLNRFTATLRQLRPVARPAAVVQRLRQLLGAAGRRRPAATTCGSTTR